MKMVRHMIAFVFSAAIIVSSMAFPTLAAETRANLNWVCEIEEFQQISQAIGNRYPGYTKVLQAFLWFWNDEYAQIMKDYGGIDGNFGEKTGDCVELYQQSRGIKVDRVVGSQTWGAIGWNLDDTIMGNGYTEFRVGSVSIFRAPDDYTPVFYYLCTDPLGYVSWVQFHPNPV